MNTPINRNYARARKHQCIGGKDQQPNNQATSDDSKASPGRVLARQTQSDCCHPDKDRFGICDLDTETSEIMWPKRRAEQAIARGREACGNSSRGLPRRTQSQPQQIDATEDTQDDKCRRKHKHHRPKPDGGADTPTLGPGFNKRCGRSAQASKIARVNQRQLLEAQFSEVPCFPSNRKMSHDTF